MAKPKKVPTKEEVTEQSSLLDFDGQVYVYEFLKDSIQKQATALKEVGERAANILKTVQNGN